MLRELRPRSIYDVMAAIACLSALAGGTAYAANEWNSSNIQNETLLSEDIKNGEIGSADVKDNSINTFDANALHGSDIIDGSLTGADVADNSLSGADVFDNSIGSADITNDSISSADIGLGSILATDIAANAIFGFHINNDAVAGHQILNGSLNDEDVGQSHFVNFLGEIGQVPARSCVERPVTGINVGGDHLLLAANSDGSEPQLSYTVEYSTSSADAVIKVCNPTNSDIDDSFTRFNLLAVDAQ